jgi:hypothetical protein
MTIGSHQATVGKSQTHITPKWIIDRLGPFDLDPCAASPRPWNCAAVNITEADDGLSAPWSGRVWLNPPFDRYVVALWMKRLAAHGNGIALLHARTETDWFRQAWAGAELLLFLDRRLHFCRQDGTPHEANSGAPVVLVAFGEDCAWRLSRSGIGGAFVERWYLQPGDAR